MKKGRLLGLMALGCMFLALIVSAKAVWADPDALVEQGKGKLLRVDAQGRPDPDLISANADFFAALNEDFYHPRANFWYGLTRILVQAQSDEMINLLTDFGCTKNDGSPLDQDALNPFGHDVKPPFNDVGKIDLPYDSPNSSEVQAFFRDTFLTEIDLALTENFSQLDESFIDHVDMQMGNAIQELDYGEVLAGRVVLNLLSALFHSFCVYDFDNLNIDDLTVTLNLARFSINELLTHYTNLFTPLADAGTHLAVAGSSLEAMLTGALEAIDFIQNETDDQSDDLITIDELDPDITEKIQRTEDTLNLFLASLNEPTQIILPEDEFKGGLLIKEIRLDLSEFFDDQDPLNLRELLPSFTADNKFLPNSVPDPTVGGVFPDLTQADWNYFMGLGPKLVVPMEDQEVNEGELLEFIVRAGVRKKAPAVTHTVENLPAGATFINQTFSWIPDYDQAGIYQVTFIASIGELFDSKTIAITVRNVNTAPVFTPIGDKIAHRRERLKFYVHAVDPEGDKVTYAVVDRPKGARFNNSTGRFSWRPRYNQAGEFVVTFIAKDGEGASDFETITITVPNTPPVFSPIEDKTVKVGQRLQFRLKASDADPIDAYWYRLRYYAVGLPKGAYLSRRSGKFSWRPKASQVGEHQIKFYVEDLAGATDEETITITVVKKVFPWWRIRYWWRRPIKWWWWR